MVGGVKGFILLLVVVMVGCGTTASWVSNPSNPNNVKIEAAIRKAANKPTGELTKADLEKVTRLEFTYNQLTELPKGLEKLTQLEELWFGYNKLTNVKGLEKLTKLEHLNLLATQLIDVKGLENLIQLTNLRLEHNQLTDVKGLEKLTKLEMLRLDDNQLTDVTGLEKLTQLTELSLRNNRALTKAQIAELQKALPNCKIYSNPTK